MHITLLKIDKIDIIRIRIKLTRLKSLTKNNGMEWGVVVAADRGAEWLLSWWWGCYSKHHQQPVAFVDFGMSQEARKWCSERGILIPFEGDTFVQSKEQIDFWFLLLWVSFFGLFVWVAWLCWF